MTAVQPRALRPEDEAAALGERLSALRDESAADPAGWSFLAATVPATGADPVSLVAAALEADLEVALWLRPSEGLALVGIGRVWAAEGVGSSRVDLQACKLEYSIVSPK